MKEIYTILRVNHWFKNAFIFIGVLSYYMFDSFDINIEMIYKVILAFLLASFISSVNYIINQITDIDTDKKHPTKKNRPLPSGRITVEVSFLISILIFGSSFYISMYYFDILFSVSLMALWIAGILYNIRPIRLKDKPYLDVVSESINNPIRFLISWNSIATSFYPPILLLLSTWTAGAVLMTAKRYDEYNTFGKKIYTYRRTFKVYRKWSLTLMLFLYSFLTLLFLGLFLIPWGRKYLPVFILSMFFVIWIIYEIIVSKHSLKDVESFAKKKEFISFCLLIVMTTLYLAYYGY